MAREEDRGAQNNSANLAAAADSDGLVVRKDE